MSVTIFEKDLLYPTANLNDPGSVNVAVMKPDNLGKLSVLIAPKSNHNPLDYKDTLVHLIQIDIFDRIRIDIKEMGIFYFTVRPNEYIKLVFQDGRQITEKVSYIPSAPSFDNT